MLPNDNQDNLLRQLGLNGQPVEQPEQEGMFTQMLNDYMAANNGPKYPDERLRDPRVAHGAPETESTDTTGNIPLIRAGGNPQTESTDTTAMIPSVPSPVSNVPAPTTAESKPANAPIIDTARADIQNAQAEADRLHRTGSGISQIHNPVLRGLARGAEAVGTMLFPAAPLVIPGTEAHHGMLIQGQMNRIARDQAIAKSEADTAQTEAETDNLGDKNVGKTPEEVTIHDLMTGENGQPRINPETGKPYSYLEAYTQVQEAKTGVKANQRAEQQPLKETTTTPDIANKMFLARYQVLHPGQALPPEMQMSDKSTVGDFKRADKELQDLLSAEGTKAQRDAANALRQQGLDAQKEKERDRQEQKSHKIVYGEKGGKTYMVSEAKAEEMGLDNISEPPSSDVSKALSARHFLPLMEGNKDAKPGDDDEGVMQIIDRLDKKGELGPLASRWQEFLASGFGAGSDPDFERLRVKLGLSKTLLMNLHVGNRGGAYMFEHFEDLANQKKMDAQTLKAGLKEEINYAKDRAMLPPKEGEQPKKVETPKTAGKKVRIMFNGQPGTIPAERLEYYKSLGAKELKDNE